MGSVKGERVHFLRRFKSELVVAWLSLPAARLPPQVFPRASRTEAFLRPPDVALGDEPRSAHLAPLGSPFRSTFVPWPIDPAAREQCL